MPSHAKQKTLRKSHHNVLLFELISSQFRQLRKFPVVNAAVKLLVKEPQVFVSASEKWSQAN